jgi:hypothetical protein
VIEEEDVVGVITMADGKVKQRIRGNTETLVECVSEVERWDVLEKWFGIVLGEQERLGIRGLSTELKGAPGGHLSQIGDLAPLNVPFLGDRASGHF